MCLETELETEFSSFCLHNNPLHTPSHAPTLMSFTLLLKNKLYPRHYNTHPAVKQRKQME